MRTAQEYFDLELARVVFGTGKLDDIKLNSDLSRKIIKNAINAARKEAIEECAERAQTEYYFSEFDDKVVLETIKVDRQSILSLVTELK